MISKFLINMKLYETHFIFLFFILIISSSNAISLEMPNGCPDRIT